MGEICRFLSLLHENFPKLAKYLRLYSKFWRITLKNVKMLLKNDFYETLCIFHCKKCFERNFWAE